MKTKFLVVFCLVLVVFSSCFFLSCNTQNEIKIGFLVHTLENERWNLEQEMMRDEVEKNGGVFYFKNAEQDDQLQYAQAKEMVESGVDVLIVSPVESTTAAKIVRLCHQKDIEVIAYDNFIENCNVDLFVSFDNIKIGRLMAQYGVENKPKGNYVLFWGDPASMVANWIREGQMEVLQPYVNKQQIEIVYKTYIEDWANRNAYFYMQQIDGLQDEEIDVVLASSDGIAGGVVSFYNGCSEKIRPIITGQDASKKALGYMEKGQQSMTIRKDFDYIARQTIDIAFQMAQNKKVQADTLLASGRYMVASKLFDIEVVDSKNLEFKQVSMQ